MEPEKQKQKAYLKMNTYLKLLDVAYMLEVNLGEVIKLCREKKLKKKGYGPGVFFLKSDIEKYLKNKQSI